MIFLLIRIYLLLPWIAFGVAVLAFVLPARLSGRAKAIWTLVLAVCSAKFVGFSVFGGNSFYPCLPTWLILGWTAACLGVTILALLGLVWWVRRGREIALPALAWGIAFLGLWGGTRAADVREIELAFPQLPMELDGYRIVQISDIHASRCYAGDRTRQLVESANALKPDLVCITGDFVDGPPEELAADLEPLRDLRAPDGVWAVRGNHEYFEYLNPHARWQDCFDRWNIRFLANECVFPRPSLALAGVNDTYAKNWRGKVRPPDADAFLRLPDVAAAFASVTGGAFRVLLQHGPAGVRENFGDHGVDLQLSGHSHGGSMPLIDRLVACDCDGFVRGLYLFDEDPHRTRALYVNSGAGQTAAFPFRFFVPSEVTCLVLRRRTR